MREFQLEDGREIAAKAREALRAVERFVEPQRGAAGAMALSPGKATLTQALPMATPGPVGQLHRMATRAAVDVENLEHANRCGDLSRALSARAELTRFVSYAPFLLAAVPSDAGAELKERMQGLLERVSVALENGPHISRAAIEAAQRGDDAQWDADLAPWRAKADPVASAEAAAKADAAAKEQAAARRQSSLNFIRLIGRGGVGPLPSGGGVTAPMKTDGQRSEQPVAAPTATTQNDASPSTSDANVEEDQVAARGTQGAGGPLPHLAAIQKSFGRHDVSSVRAHIGGDAAAASKSLGAEAFAYGNAVAFAASPDLHTAAHEAAHVVQQRSGVSLKGGVGAESDAYERHADLVADDVVRGKSVEALLDSMAGGGGRTAAVQRKSSHGAPRRDVAPDPAPPIGAASLEPDLDEVQQTTQLAAQIRASLLPAYRRAVDALDVAAARELGGAIVAAVQQAMTITTRARAAIHAGPHAAMVSMPNSPTNDTPEAAQRRFDQLVASTKKLDEEWANLTATLAVQLGPQVYKGTLVLGKAEQPRLGKDPAASLSRETMTMIALLETIHKARVIANAKDAACTALNAAQQKQIAAIVEPWRSRPVNYAFLVQALRDIGLWDNLAAAKGPSGNTLSATANSSMAQALRMGRIADVGNFDREEAAKILTGQRNDQRWRPDILGGPLPDRDTAARTIYQQILSAAPDAQGPIIRDLHAMGKLGFLCDHLPRREVEALYASIRRLDLAAARLLAPYFEGKGDGESLHKRYMNQVDQRLAEGATTRAFGWFALDAVHDGLTGGFHRGYSDAYDANQQGLTTDDEFKSAVATQAGRAGALTAVSAATGGVAGTYSEGLALGVGAGNATAQIAGGMIGGAASGVSGQFAADVYDQALLDKDGFSSAGDYLFAAGAGAGTGLATASVAALGRDPKPSKGKSSSSPAKERFFTKSLKKASQAYAKNYPKLDNLLTRIRNAGVRNGLVLRVSGPALLHLAASGLTNNPAKLQAAVARYNTVKGNRRIDVNSRPLAKVHPQSEIEALYGTVDETTGKVSVRTKNPTSAGFVADAEAFAGKTRLTDQAVREVLGIDTDPLICNDYAKYNRGDADPLFEVTFNVHAELDVALPQGKAPGIALGEMDPVYHHVAGAGKTKGQIPEGLLPSGTPIEIVEIRPVGTPRASYPSVPTAPGGPTAPFPPAAAAVRKPAAPLSSASASIATPAAARALMNLLYDHEDDDD